MMRPSKTLEQLAMIGDTRTAGLIGEQGNLEWLCWPDFDSEACFASLIGSNDNGCWTLAPAAHTSVSRRYLPGTLVLETTYTRPFGASVTVTDFMPVGTVRSTVIRNVRCHKGRFRMRTRFAPRFDYGSAQPLLQRQPAGCWNAVAGPLRLTLHSNVPMRLEGVDLVADWIIAAGANQFFTLQQSNSYMDAEPGQPDAERLEQEATRHWETWSAQSTYKGTYKTAVNRSLLTLKALTYSASGGYVAAPTTSLPEKVGGIRNWDYRFCWLRDTTFSLLGLLHCGYREEARDWLQWLSRSVQGDPASLKIMYGITGTREHSEWTAKWLSGYLGSSPVHIGNKASDQLQLDTFGELLDTLYRARCHGLYPLEDKSGEALEIPLLEHLETLWDKPDAGLWEMRSESQQFTQSKVMCWVAFDRGVRLIERFGIKGPVERWRKLRAKIHAQVCSRGYHAGMNSFTQAYGTRHMDASMLLLPLVGFLPIDDPRITGTVRSIEKYLMRDGLLMRYDSKRVNDGLPPGEGAFLACNFWLVDVYLLQGRKAEAAALFETLLALANSCGLLSEEHDPKYGLIGNFPQAFSHIGLVNAALGIEIGRPVRLHDLD
jgi:GH15 family glucan-1,4-alpha-glucosidase